MSNKVAPVNTEITPMAKSSNDVDPIEARKKSTDRYKTNDTGMAENGGPVAEFRKSIARFLDIPATEKFFGILIVGYVLCIFVDMMIAEDEAMGAAVWAPIFLWIDAILLSIFSLEIIFKLIGYGIRTYLSSPLNAIDAIVVGGSLILAYQSLQMQIDGDTGGDEAYRSYTDLLKFVRLLGVMVVLNKISRARSALLKMRYLASIDTVESPVIKVLEMLQNYRQKSQEDQEQETLDWVIRMISTEKLYVVQHQQTNSSMVSIHEWEAMQVGYPLIDPNPPPVAAAPRRGSLSLTRAPPEDLQPPPASTRDSPRAMEDRQLQSASVKQRSGSVRTQYLQSQPKAPSLFGKDDIESAGLKTLKSAKEIQLQELLDNCGNWDYDIFELNELSMGQPVFALGFHLFNKYNFFDKFNIDPRVLAGWLRKVEAGYQNENDYHNHLHAADVLQAFHNFINMEHLKHFGGDLDRMAGYVACIVHDYQHPGFNNAFLNNIGADIALVYNDKSTLEAHHVAATWKMMQNSSVNIFKNLPMDKLYYARKLVTSAVLGTDMSVHFEALGHFKGKIAVDGLKASDLNDRMFVLKMALHTADISNPARPLKISAQWSERVTKEFIFQGDKERQLGLPVGPMNNRHVPGGVKPYNLQKGFSNLFVTPLYQTWHQWIGQDFDHIAETLQSNGAKWDELQDNLLLEVLGKNLELPPEPEASPKGTMHTTFTGIEVPIEHFQTLEMLPKLTDHVALITSRNRTSTADRE